MSTECGDADNILHAITIRDPWATLIANSVKTVENRVRPTRHRGTVAIHAGKTIDGAAYGIRSVYDAIADITAISMNRHPGSIIAIATLADCHRDTGSCCGDWAERDVWHLVLSDVHRLERPIPARGSLALPWVVPADAAEQVWAQLPIGAGR